MMKRLAYIVSLALVVALSACDPTPLSFSDKVEIVANQVQVSAGFCEYEFNTSEPAYYITGVMPVNRRYDPATYPKQFMNLILDSAKIDYIAWRRQLLMDGISHVADFSSHSLQYGLTDRFFNALHPNTDYWVYAFVVDAQREKPVGQLFIEEITTKEESDIWMHFNYRVNDCWDYIYPVNESGELITNVPWVGETMDSIKLREMGAETPGRYFSEQFAQRSYDSQQEVFYGVYSHRNDGSGRDAMLFEQGHTYYTALACFDGPILAGTQPRCFDIFRFTWSGPGTQLFLTHEQDNTSGAW